MLTTSAVLLSLLISSGHVKSISVKGKEGGNQIQELVVLDQGRRSSCLGDEGCYLNNKFDVILQFILVIGDPIKGGDFHIDVTVQGQDKPLLNQARRLCEGKRPMSLSLSQKCPENSNISVNNYTVTAKLLIPSFKGTATLRVGGPGGVATSKRLIASSPIIKS